MEQGLFNLDENLYVAIVPAEISHDHILQKLVLMDKEEGWIQDIVDLVYMPEHLKDTIMLQVYSDRNDDGPTNILYVPLTDEMSAMMNSGEDDGEVKG